jgi:serine/threonine-protein kinase
LPGEEWVLFTIGSENSSDWNEAQIVVQSLRTGERKILVSGGSDGRYVPTGHLLYALGDVLYAKAFNTDSMEVLGGAFPVIEGLARAGVTGSANYAFSDTGMLSHVAGATEAVLRRTLVWVDRNGEEELLATEPKIYYGPRISPDGTKVAVTVWDEGGSDIWIWDLIRENMTRLTLHEALDHNSLWTPDGQKIVFASSRESSGSIYWKPADGTGEAQNLCSTSGSEVGVSGVSWSGDGDTLLLQSITPTGSNIEMLSMKGDHTRKPLLQEKYFERQPQISPDGRWMAYTSDQSGENQIYVRPFPEVNKTMWTVSTNGGNSPLWSPDGRELFYRIGNSIMAVEVEADPTFSAGKPTILFQGEYMYAGNPSLNPWDISLDGKRFLMVKQAEAATTEEESRPKINIILNWFEELKDRVPAD